MTDPITPGLPAPSPPAAPTAPHAHEEVGLPPREVDVVGALAPVGTFVTNYAIYPFVGLIEHGFEWVREEAEVAEVLEFALDYLEPMVMGPAEAAAIDDNPLFTLRDMGWTDRLGIRTVDDIRRMLRAGADVTFLPLDATRSVVFELNGSLKVESIERDGKPLTGFVQDAVGVGSLGPSVRIDLGQVVRVVDVGGWSVRRVEPRSFGRVRRRDIGERTPRRCGHLHGERRGHFTAAEHLAVITHHAPDLRFDRVIMNPPFHRGRTQDVGIAHRFIAVCSVIPRTNSCFTYVPLSKR